MTAFCGDDTFWNSSQFMSNDWPKMTSCFQMSILVWIPCGWLWLAFVPHLNFIYRQNPGNAITSNTFHITKMMLSLALCIALVMEAVGKDMDAKSHDTVLPPVFWLAFGLRLLSYILTVVLIHLDRIKGSITSNILWIFWCLSIVTSIVPFYSRICLQEYKTDRLLYTLFCLQFFFLCVQCVLATIVETPRYLDKHVNPEIKATVPSKLFFWWISGFIIQIYKEGLKEENMFDLHPRDKATRVVSQFEIPWKQEIKRYETLNGQLDYSCDGYSSFEQLRSQYSSSTEESTPLMRKSSSSRIGVRKGKKPSLFKVLMKTYALELIQSHFLMLVFDLLQFANPLLLGILIHYSQDSRQSRESTQRWPSYFIAACFFLVGLVGSVALNQCYHLGMTLGMRVKNALLAAVFKKSLSMSRSAHNKVKVEETVNLMSVNCQRLQDLVAYLWMLWSAPFEIIVASYLLWRVIGLAMFWGVMVIILLMPINAVIASRQKKNVQELAKIKSRRVKLTKELVEGIQVLKIYTWERILQTRIERIRAEEIQIVKKGFLTNAISTFCWFCSPFLVLLVTFSNYEVTSDEAPLDAYKAFVSLALFNILRFPVNLLPVIFTLLFQGISTVEKLEKFLTSEDEIESKADEHPNRECAIQIDRGHFTWDKTLGGPSVLSSIDLRIPSGQLVAVVGPAGSGKSSLLSAIAGEMDKLHGSVIIKSSNIIHTPQQAWIQSSSFKDNIMFGKVKDKLRYSKVIVACCLKDDLELLPHRDKTELGERGVIVTESQRQRIALARALYSKANIYLLDEPLSDVDSVVANQIFSNVISNQGLMKKLTRVLVTNNLHWLPQTDLVVMMTDGQVSEIGPYDILLSKDGHLTRFMKSLNISNSELSAAKGLVDNVARNRPNPFDFEESLTSDLGLNPAEEFLSSTESAISHHIKFDLSESVAVEDEIKERERRVREMILAEERAEITRMRLSIFWTYFKVMGYTSTAILFILFLAYQCVSIYSNIWLTVWTRSGQSSGGGLINGTHAPDRNSYFYLGVYGCLGALQAAFIISFSFLSFIAMTGASRTLHNQVLSKVTRSPMAFFDQMSSARVMTRFCKDVEIVDTWLPLHFRSWMNTFFATISTIVIISYCVPVFLAVVLPLGLLFYALQFFYIPTSRQLKNLESSSRSCVYTQFRDTMTGISTIRTFGAGDRFIKQFLEKMDKTAAFYFACTVTNRWLAIGVEMIGNLVVTSTVLFSVSVFHINESLVGLALAFALQMTSSLSWMVRALTDLETNIFSVQRMSELTQIAPEAIYLSQFKRPPSPWPQHGAIHFFNTSTLARRGLYPELKPLNLYIEAGEKIGIMGRTKTEALSVRDAVFHLVEVTSGSILIDNTIISDVGIQDLRSRITFFPAEPLIFSGSLRMNLDPTNAFSEDDIWSALERAGIKETVSGQLGGLRFDCGHCGKNLNLKQCYMVSLARVLLHKKKILIMEDSDGVGIDPEIDDIIQTRIRAEFQDCTVLTFASRINTIVDYDRVIVFDNGVMVEADHPKTLLRNKSSLLYHMANAANLL